MIPFDFEYYRPDTVQEALTVFRQLDAEHKNPMYYGGGSEIISMARLGNIRTGAVIDLKAIPECGVLGSDRSCLQLGSALTISNLIESKRFPLLDKTAGRIADHTMQCKITLGGNLASTIIYRETVLPLLLTEATVAVASCGGSGDCIREYKIDEVFHQRLDLARGEFIVRVSVEKRWLSCPYVHVKKTRNEKVDYPLMTVAALKTDGKIRFAVSGLLEHPLRNSKLEDMMNRNSLDFAARAEAIADELDPFLLSNLNGSASFRKYLLKNTLVNILETLRDA